MLYRSWYQYVQKTTIERYQSACLSYLLRLSRQRVAPVATYQVLTIGKYDITIFTNSYLNQKALSRLKKKKESCESIFSVFEMNERLNPRDSGAYIAKNAEHVQLQEEGIKKVSSEVYEALKCGQLHLKGFSQVELHPQKADEKAIDWIFVVDTLNFCFWKPPNSRNKWEVKYHGKIYTGYFALCAAINRAIEEGLPITDPTYYANINLQDLQNIFRSETSQPIPLLEERCQSLHEVGEVLLKKYNGSFVNCIKQSDNSAQMLLKIVTDNFPCFRDEAEFKKCKVSFYKRAQILIGDIWACFGGQGLGNFEDIDSFVMFADYRVPQVLVYFGALQYSEHLMKKLESEEILKNGSSEEIEIRGCCIEAVEQILKQVKKLIEKNEVKNLQINSILIDHFLWDYRRRYADKLEIIPFHKTPCIYY